MSKARSWHDSPFVAVCAQEELSTESDGVRLLFLDLDGVICCNYHGELEAAKLEQLARIVEVTHCQVVLSSDWRRQPHLCMRAESALCSYGVTCIGATPQYPIYARVRPKEILAWMADYKGPIAGWCAIDDRDLVLEEGGAPAFVNHFVLTEFSIGLSGQLADRVIDRLSRSCTSNVTATTVAAMSSRPLLLRPMPSAAEHLAPSTAAVNAPAAAAATAERGAIPLTSMNALLLESSLGHLEGVLRGETLRGLHHRLQEAGVGRVGFLSHLRAIGLARIGDRQALANSLGRASRQGRLDWLLHATEAEAEEDALATGSNDDPHGTRLRGSFHAGTREADDTLSSSTTSAMIMERPIAASAASAVPTAAATHAAAAIYAAAPARIRSSAAAAAADPLPATPTPSSTLLAAMEIGTLDALRDALEECSELASPMLVMKACRMRDELKQWVAARAPPVPERAVRVEPVGSRGHVTGGLLSVQPHAQRAAVLCHPHPGRGGDMYNAFIASIFVLLRDRGVSTLRFNMSAGEDGADPDDLDALLHANKSEAAGAVALLHRKSPASVPVMLVGVSWGAVVSLAVARNDPPSIQALALVAPPIGVLPSSMHPGRGDFARWPILLTAGDADEYCDVQQLQAIAGGAATTCLVLDSATHFLHGDTARAAALQVDEWVSSLMLE